MLTRKTQYGWIVVGGILCLCGGVVALKVREGNPVVAQGEPAPPPPLIQPDGPAQSAPKPLAEVAIPPGPAPTAPPMAAPPVDPLPPSAPRSNRQRRRRRITRRSCRLLRVRRLRRSARSIPRRCCLPHCPSRRWKWSRYTKFRNPRLRFSRRPRRRRSFRSARSASRRWPAWDRFSPTTSTPTARRCATSPATPSALASAAPKSTNSIPPSTPRTRWPPGPSSICRRTPVCRRMRSRASSRCRPCGRRRLRLGRNPCWR